MISAFNPSPVTSDDCSGHSFHGHVIYSYFSFLKVDLSLMSQHDVCFLDTQGCFKVPNRQALDEFVHEYFLHVHPSLPLIDESAFWKMYSGNGSFSLLLFQAMLFASSGVGFPPPPDVWLPILTYAIVIVPVIYHSSETGLYIDAECKGNLLPARQGRQDTLN